MKTLRDIMRESGRLEEVMELVVKLSTSDSSIPLFKFQLDEDRKAVTRVEAESVRKGIKIWQKYLDTNGESVTDEESKQMLEFSWVVDSEAEMRMHNYAVTVAHRKVPTEHDIDNIRAWLILEHSIYHLMFRYYSVEDDSFIEFDIPNGWKAA